MNIKLDDDDETSKGIHDLKAKSSIC